MNEKFDSVLNQVNPEILENPNENLIEEEVIDSLAIMNMVTRFESAFHFDFDPEDITQENFETVEKIKETVRKYGVKV